MTEWTAPRDDCPSWCQHHRTLGEGFEVHHRPVITTGDYNRVLDIYLSDVDSRAVFDDGNSGKGPGLSIRMWPDCVDPAPPGELRQAEARDLITRLQDALRVIEDALPDVCPGCGDHCVPDEGGLCWHCVTAADIETNKRRRDTLRSVEMADHAEGISP